MLKLKEDRAERETGMASGGFGGEKKRLGAKDSEFSLRAANARYRPRLHSETASLGLSPPMAISQMLVRTGTANESIYFCRFDVLINTVCKYWKAWKELMSTRPKFSLSGNSNSYSSAQISMIILPGGFRMTEYRCRSASLVLLFTCLMIWHDDNG